LTSETAAGRHKTFSSRNSTEDWMKLVWLLANRKISAKLRQEQERASALFSLDFSTSPHTVFIFVLCV
jgi:hypothetical protein